MCVPHPVIVGGTPSSHGGEGGYPSSHERGVPHPVMVGGVPHPVIVGGGTWGIPHHPDLAGGYPWYPPSTSQTWLGYPPHHPDLAGGVPPRGARPGQGTPPPSRPGWGTPPHHPDLAGIPLPPSCRPGWGTPPQPSRPGWGTPPLQSRCELTNKLKTVPSPILRMRAVIIMLFRNIPNGPRQEEPGFIVSLYLSWSHAV